jgi:hypothetical protein
VAAHKLRGRVALGEGLRLADVLGGGNLGWGYDLPRCSVLPRACVRCVLLGEHSLPKRVILAGSAPSTASGTRYHGYVW